MYVNYIELLEICSCYNEWNATVMTRMKIINSPCNLFFFLFATGLFLGIKAKTRNQKTMLIPSSSNGGNGPLKLMSQKSQNVKKT